MAVPDQEAAQALQGIRKRIQIPLIADIHFDDRLALTAMRGGVDGIRINPGNISRNRLEKIIIAAGERDIAIRIGINAGSLEKNIMRKHGKPSAQALVESALESVALCEGLGFTRLKISLKSSDVPTMVESYRLMSASTAYPLHLGVTEAGSLLRASIKSAMGLGILLGEGIGDTIRVSVTGDPVSEIPIANGILRGLNIRMIGPDIISCPTCGRCEINMTGLVREVEKRLSGMKTYLKVALMGCVVNGPGEAAEADVGIAGGRKMGLLFKKGKAIRKIREEEFVQALMEEINKMCPL